MPNVGFEVVGIIHASDPGLSGVFGIAILLTCFTKNRPDARERTVQISLLSFNARQGDAIGHQVVSKANYFRERGSAIRVYVQQHQLLHPDLKSCVHVAAEGNLVTGDLEYLKSSDLVIAQYGQHYELLDCLPRLVGSKPKILVDYHGVTPPDLWGKHNNQALKRGVRRRELLWLADAILTHSDFTTNELKRFGIPSERIWKVRYAIDLPNVDREESRRRFRQRFGFRDQRVLLYVGRFAPNKRVPLLVESLKVLVGASDDAHLVLVGDTSDLYRQELTKVNDLAAEFELSGRVHVLGQLVGTPLYDAFCGSDVFVTASEWESFCIPLVEAMHFGLPVVGARATAISGTIANNGLTFRLNEAGDLADVLLRLRKPRFDSLQGPSESDCLIPTRSASEDLSEAGNNASGVVHNSCSDNRPKAEFPASGEVPRSHFRLVENHPNSTTPEVVFPASLRSSPALRVGVVDERPSSDTIAVVIDNSSVVNGVANSLKTIARSLAANGRRLEVFVAGKPKGKESEEFRGCCVSFFPTESGDSEVLQRFSQAIRHSRFDSAQDQERYIGALSSSASLAEALRTREEAFAAVLVGPYLSQLSVDVARACPKKTLLVPCFHDEAQAYWDIWHRVYRDVGGLLFHSQSEANFAQAELGFNHPNAEVIGTFLEETNTSMDLPRELNDARYLVYCGRYVEEKHLPQLLEWAERYQAAHPGRWKFVFVGSGPISVAKAKWALDLGVLPCAKKHAVLAHADALIQLSCNESLSLVALEAWQQGTPVIGHQECAVLAEHIGRWGDAASGWLVSDYRSFAETLNLLWENEDSTRVAGAVGRAFVEREYRNREKFAAFVERAVSRLSVPLVEQMRNRGFEHAQHYVPSRWLEQFDGVVEKVLDQTPRDAELALEVRRRVAKRKVSRGTPSFLVPVRVRNWGEYPAVADGSLRIELCAQVTAAETGEVVAEVLTTPLPKSVPPGKTISAAVRVPVPETLGKYKVRFWARRADCRDEPSRSMEDRLSSTMKLLVTKPGSDSQLGCSVLMDHVQDDIHEAEELQKLPDDYLDVTQGMLAKLKRRIKNKLLNNFKVAYVDVLSRQQSAFNQQILNVVKELAECCAMLDHAVQQLQRRADAESESLRKRKRQRQ